jgi:hypothetical protein
MALYGPIQAIPPGLLGLLQLKTVGRNPGELDSTVTPGFELSDWYLRANQEQLNTSFTQLMAATAGGGYQPFTTPSVLTVPDGEWWYIAHYAVRGGLAVGDTINQMRIALQTNRTGTVRFGRFGAPSTLAGQGSLVCFDNDFWAPPGAEFGVHVSNVTSAAGVTLTADLRFTACPL